MPQATGSLSRARWIGLLTTLALGVATFLPSSKAEDEAARVPHPKQVRGYLPEGGAHVRTNPPTLRWPAGRGPYRIRLSRDPTFPDGATLTAERAWALWNPHRRLENGTWHWQVERRGGRGRRGGSKPSTFEVDEDSRLFVTPPPEAMLAAVPASHPRLLATPGEVEGLRARASSLPETAPLLERARRTLALPVPTEAQGRATQGGKNPAQAKRFADWASKKLGGRILRGADVLVKAWLLEGDEAVGRKAVAIALAVARFDVDGVTSPRVSDFADGACLMTLALVFDTCHDLLDEAERTLILGAIRVRAGRLYERWHDRLEAQFFAAHTWQTILRQFTYAAFATLGDIPEARTWASYVYELWIGRFPLLGEDDGGWANGNNYFRTNFDSLVYIPLLFQDLTGVDFFAHPWYRSTIPYLLTTWPPGSRDVGFGDGHERRGLPHLGYLAFMDVLARELQSPLAAWYVKKGLEDSPKPLAEEGTFAWYRMRRGPSHPSPEPLGALAALGLPKGRCFPGIGVVSIHSDLAHIPRDLHVAMRSSPFGAFNHAHADQNSVNLLFGGQPLLQGSGYYIAYGDPHYRGWYKHTRGHNTVLINGQGQAFQPQAFGRVTQFLSGRAVQYARGDASHAYPGTGLKRFDRHLVVLQPNVVLIYDDLEAQDPADWTWSVHCPGSLELLGEAQGFLAGTSSASAKVHLFASTDLDLETSRAFVPPADNWRGIEGRKGVRKIFPDQGHGTADNREKCRVMRFLAVIQVGDAAAKDASSLLVLRGRPGNGEGLHLGRWTLKAEMDPGKPASLLVENVGAGIRLRVNPWGAGPEDAAGGAVLEER